MSSSLFDLVFSLMFDSLSPFHGQQPSYDSNQILKERHKHLPHKNEWFERLTDMVPSIEDFLYKEAPSLEAYTDESTLPERIHDWAVKTVKGAKNENGTESKNDAEWAMEILRTYYHRNYASRNGEHNFYCNWCGSKILPAPGDVLKSCPCKVVYYCNEDCSEAAWYDGHYLQCPAGKDKRKKGKFKIGDVVTIGGLVKAVHLNGILAEVESYNEESGRYHVLFTVKEQCLIKKCRIKPENMQAYSRVHEAASQANKVKLGKLHGKKYWEQTQEKYDILYEALPTMTGKEIVELLEIGDKLLGAIILPTEDGGRDTVLTMTQVEEMFENGLIDCCLQRFEYPACLDENLEETIRNHSGKANTKSHQYIHFLGDQLMSNMNWRAFEDKRHLYRIETTKKLGPLIMLCASKKRRLQGTTGLWWKMYASLMRLLHICLFTYDHVSSILLHELEPRVTEELLNLVVFSFTADPNQYLDKKASMNEKIDFLTIACSNLCELADCNNVGEEIVSRIGKLTIPAGVKHMAGQPFAKCLRYYCAIVALEAINTSRTRDRDIGKGLIKHFDHVYENFYSCLDLRDMMGDYDDDLINRVESSSQLERWAEDLFFLETPVYSSPSNYKME